LKLPLWALDFGISFAFSAKNHRIKIAFFAKSSRAFWLSPSCFPIRYWPYPKAALLLRIGNNQKQDLERGNCAEKNANAFAASNAGMNCESCAVAIAKKFASARSYLDPEGRSLAHGYRPLSLLLAERQCPRSSRLLLLHFPRFAHHKRQPYGSCF